jgi:hypothetical protein
MTALSPTYDQSYIIGNSPLSWSITGSSVTSQVPACGYSQSLSSVTTPSFITAGSGGTINFSAHSTSFTDEGVHTITVASTLEGYNFDPPVAAPTCQSTFTVTAIASCINSPTTLQPPTPSLAVMTTTVFV